jgi:hypothetical protein
MRKHCSNVCKLRPCLATGSTNSVRMRTIVTAALQRQYSQTELIFSITLVVCAVRQAHTSCEASSWQTKDPALVHVHLS